MVFEDYKFVVIVNKKVEIGKALNAVSHSLAGLVASAPKELREKMSFIDFEDKDGFKHQSISALSLIVLRGGNGDLKKVRNSFIENKVHFVDFTDTMTGDTYKEQLQKTKEKPSAELEYYAVAAFGEKDVLNPLTKKYSLWH